MTTRAASKRQLSEELRAKKAANLELQLFGGVASKKPAEDDEESSSSEAESDRSGSVDSEVEEQRRLEKKKAKAAKRRKAVLAEPEPKKYKGSEEECLWEDEDDDNQVLTANFIRTNAPDVLTATDLVRSDKIKKFSKRIRDQFVERSRLGQKLEWVARAEEESKRDASGDDSDEDEALAGLRALEKSTGKYIGRPAQLPRTYLQSNKLPDPTMAHQKAGKKLKVVKFHPSEPVLLTANTCGHIQLYRVAQSLEDLQRVKGDAFLQEVRLKNFKIDSLNFFDDGASIFISSNRNEHFYEYDLMSGHVNQHLYPKNLHREHRTGLRSRLSADGELVAFLGQGAELHVFSRASMSQLHTFVAPSRLADALFSPVDSNIIYAITESGECLIWNMRAKGTQERFRDDGCVRCNAATLSPSGQFLATAQNTGIVNVYETKDCHSGTDPRPVHSFSNLVTSASFLAFNHDSQMLAFGSEEKPMAIRISHTQSGTVFKNFPAKSEVLAKASLSCVDFSPHSAFGVFGTLSGTVRLYRLPYYEKY